MKVTLQNNYSYTYPMKKPVFQSASGDFGKAVGDVFQKETISETARNNLIDKLRLAIKEIIKPENFMGRGFYGTVYRIDKDFVMKIKNYAKPSLETSDLVIKKGKNIFKNLKTYYGEEVLQIGDLKILRNLGKHTPAGVPPEKLKDLKSLEEIYKYYQKEYLPLFAKVPQKSYDAVAEDFARLNKMKYSAGEYCTFDSKNPGNILLAGDELKLTDEINSINMSDTNSVGKLMELMLYKISSLDSIRSYGDNTEEAKQILRKILIASEKANLPYDTRERDRVVWDGVFKNAEINEDVDDFIQNLEIIRGRNPRLSKRIPEVEKYVDRAFCPSFKGRSRELEKVLDNVVGKPEISEKEKNLIIEKIKNALQDILIPSRFIEEGTHNAVYKITTKYAARVPVNTQITPSTLGEGFEWGKGIFSRMRNYYGEPILQAGKFQILHNIGFQMPAGIPEHLSKTMSEHQQKKYYIEKYLPKFASISQYNYNQIARDLAILNEMRFGPRSFGLFDSLNPNNIVYGKKSLLLVDEIETLCDKPYANTTAKLLEVFINRATKDREAPDAGEKVKLVRKIFKKTLIAGMYADLLHADSKEDCRNWEIALRKCQIKTPLFEIINKMEQIGAMPFDMDEKITIARRYIDTLFSVNPTNI